MHMSLRSARKANLLGALALGAVDRLHDAVAAGHDRSLSARAASARWLRFASALASRRSAHATIRSMIADTSSRRRQRYSTGLGSSPVATCRLPPSS